MLRRARANSTSKRPLSRRGGRNPDGSEVRNRGSSWVMDRITFCWDLIEWYWQHGSGREDDYAIPTSSWLKKLYEAEKQLTAIADARAKPRPAMAIWGPSQTGKSTLVAFDIDAQALYPRTEGVDGTGSGLHWPGGAPMFFMAPEAAPPAYLNRYVLNPFNQGWDGAHFVRDVRHPVDVHLIAAKDLLQVIARGYDTECLGPTRTGDATIWTIAEFESRLAKFKRRSAAAGKTVARPAYEALFDLCEVMGDLVAAELPRYKKLLEEGEENWRSLTASLLADSALLSDPKVVADLAADLLWDGYEPLTVHFRRLQGDLCELGRLWGGKPVLASLEAAAIFLNMEACRIFFDPRPSDPNTQEGVVYESISSIGWREENGVVLIGCGPEYRHSLSDSPERFAQVQALVWELVVPLNPAHLSDGPFKSYLRDADLLDFAGVGNEPKSDVSRIDLEPSKEDVPAKGKPFE